MGEIWRLFCEVCCFLRTEPVCSVGRACRESFDEMKVLVVCGVTSSRKKNQTPHIAPHLHHIVMLSRKKNMSCTALKLFRLLLLSWFGDSGVKESQFFILDCLFLKFWNQSSSIAFYRGHFITLMGRSILDRKTESHRALHTRNKVVPLLGKSCI